MLKNKNNLNKNKKKLNKFNKNHKNNQILMKNRKWKIIDINADFVEEDSLEIELKNMNKYVEI